MVRVTKEAVLGGPAHTIDVEVEELGGSITIRPLSSLEYAKFQQILMKSIRISGEKSITKLAKGIADIKDLSLGDFLLNQTEASIYALSRSIVDDLPWTQEEVAKLPSKVIDKLLDKVLEITGVAPGMEAAVKKFRRK